MDQIWNCPLCLSFAAPNLKAVIRHVGAVHAHEAVFCVRCGIQGCPRTYRNFHSYKKHMYTKHRDILEVFTPDAEQEHSENIDDDQLTLNGQDSNSSQPASPLLPQNETRNSALFLMKMKEISKISQGCLDGLVEDVALLLQKKMLSLEAEMYSALRHRGVEIDSELRSIFRHHEISPFQGIETEFLQKKFYKENFGLLEPVERRLGQSVHIHEATSSFKRSCDYVYEVPLLSSLKQFLSDNLILEEVLRGHTREDELLSDYCDGSEYQSHPLFVQCPKALQIIVYYDDVEVCNPLGSRAKTHKIALFYYTLGNISPKYRSSLRSIQLLAVLKSSVLQQYGPDLILQTLMQDVKLLEKDDGVTFEIEGRAYNFRGTITVVPGDNLASQYLGGYKSLSGALRKCRHCMAVDENMQQKFLAEDYIPRTRETHASQCSSLGGHLHNHFATTYGLHRDSILNQSCYYHVTEGLVPDAMHDVLEGVLPLVTKEMLKHHIESKTFSLAYLNQVIKTFPYAGPDARNKPAPILAKVLSSTDHSLKQTATQMWCLARLLPLMIGNKVNKSDVHWNNFLLLLTIVDHVLAPVVSSDSIAYLRILIDDHHQTFKTLYPSCRITPKMHYLIHYPECMSRFGPLVRCWCMRFEGKHNYFKDLAHRVKCFKNIPKTMATRHQHLQAYYSACSNGSNPFYKETEAGIVSETALRLLDFKELLLDSFTELSEEDNIKRLSWVQVDGSAYHIGDVIVLKSELLPTFGVIKDIVVFDVDNFFLLLKY